MLQGEHSAILLTFIKLPFVIRFSFSLFLSSRFTQVLLHIHVSSWVRAVNIHLSFHLSPYFVCVRREGSDVIAHCAGLSEASMLSFGISTKISKLALF